MNFYVYLICTKTKKGKLISYVGYTNNIKNRLSLHNISKGAKFTRGRFWKLLYKKKFSIKSNALKYEYALKKDRNMRELIKKEY